MNKQKPFETGAAPIQCVTWHAWDTCHHQARLSDVFKVAASTGEASIAHLPCPCSAPCLRGGEEQSVGALGVPVLV